MKRIIDVNSFCYLNDAPEANNNAELKKNDDKDGEKLNNEEDDIDVYELDIDVDDENVKKQKNPEGKNQTTV